MQKYLENLAQEQEDVVAEQASVDEVANSILSCHLDAFKELAKWRIWLWTKKCQRFWGDLLHWRNEITIMSF